MCQNTFNEEPIIVLVQAMQQLANQIHVNSAFCKDFIPDNLEKMTIAFQEAEQLSELLKRSLENILILMNNSASPPSISRSTYTFFE